MHVYQVEALVWLLEKLDLLVGDEHVDASSAVADDGHSLHLVLHHSLLLLLLVELLTAVRGLSLLGRLGRWFVNPAWNPHGDYLDGDGDSHPRL